MNTETNTKAYCRKCGKEIPGVSLGFLADGKWICHSCSDNKGNVLFSEHGVHVRVKSFSAGNSYERELVEKYLAKDQVYTIDRINVGRNYTDVWLVEVPDLSFNSVFFENVD